MNQPKEEIEAHLMNGGCVLYNTDDPVIFTLKCDQVFCKISGDFFKSSYELTELVDDLSGGLSTVELLPIKKQSHFPFILVIAAFIIGIVYFNWVKP